VIEGFIRPDRVLLSVQDSGPGVKPEMMPRSSNASVTGACAVSSSKSASSCNVGLGALRSGLFVHQLLGLRYRLGHPPCNLSFLLRVSRRRNHASKVFNRLPDSRYGDRAVL
jgi:hypothetical protein